MNEIVTYISNSANFIESHWEQIGATLISGYSFVIAHGGLIPMWNKFLGTTQQVERINNEKTNITPVAVTASASGNGPTA